MKLLKSIAVENFRSLSDAVLPSLGDITILIGPNNCGKSTLLRAVAKLKEQSGSAEFQFKGEDSEARLAEQGRAGWQSRLLGLEELRPRAFAVADHEFRTGANSVEFTFVFEHSAVGSLVRRALGPHADDVFQRGIVVEPGDSPFSVTGADDGTGRIPESYWDLHFSGVTFGHEVTQTNLGWFCLRSAGDLLKQRVVFCEDARLQSYAGKSLEEYIRGTSLNADQYVTLKDWLRSVIDMHISNYLPNEQRVAMDSGYEANMSALGSGVRSLVCLAADIIASPDESCILIDEPELGLNPMAKQRFFALLRDQAKRKQIIIATHDPTFTNPALWKDAQHGLEYAIYMFSETDDRFVKVNGDISREVAGSFAGYLPHTTSPRDFHLYVEGRYDAQTLRCLLDKCLWDRSCWWQVEDRVEVFHLGGAYWEKLLPTVPSGSHRCLVVLDGDKERVLFDGADGDKKPLKDRMIEAHPELRIEFFRGSECWEGDATTDLGKNQFSKMHRSLMAPGLGIVVYTLSKEKLDDYFPGEPPGKENIPLRAHKLDPQSIPTEIRMLLALIPVAMTAGTWPEFAKEFGIPWTPPT